MVKKKFTHTEKGPFCLPSKDCQLWLVGRGVPGTSRPYRHAQTTADDLLFQDLFSD